MLDGEWAVRKEAMMKWMEPENFDEKGQQVRGLRAIREELLDVEGWRQREADQARKRQPPGLMQTLSHFLIGLQSQWVWVGAVLVFTVSLFQMYKTE